MNQQVAEAVLTCACGDCGCGDCRKLLTETDVKVAAFEECAQWAETLAKTYGSLTAAGCQAVADKIRQEMALLQEMVA